MASPVASHKRARYGGWRYRVARAFKNGALNLSPHPLVTPLKAWSIRGYIEHTNNCRVVGRRGGFVGRIRLVTSWWLMLKRGMRLVARGGFCAVVVAG